MSLETPSYKEDHISQVPALQLLQNLGYTYLTPDDALMQRNGKTTGVLLEGILRKQLERINSISYKGQTFIPFSQANIQAGLLALRDLPINEGYIASCEYIYNLLTLGKALEQSIDGDKKSYTLKYIDWETPENNVFHVTEEYSVMRAGCNDHYRPDIVLFVNGIPLAVIECKRPDDEKPIAKAIAQHLRNQQEDGIRLLYIYAQVLLGIATNDGKYATNGTPEKHWSKWEEKFTDAKSEASYHAELHRLKNTPLPIEQKEKLFSDRFKYVRAFFDSREQEDIAPTGQDAYLYGLCRPERLLDLMYHFIVFDAGEKKIAHYPQFFVLKKTTARILSIGKDGKRKGGVIWHTQGSGKSLTMVLLAQAIALEPTIRNPKIILVTDRTDLDKQIWETFQKCKRPVMKAPTGRGLVELLEDKSDAVITTTIHKFETAVRTVKRPFDSPDIFVLVDEDHRSQYGSFFIQMVKTLPNACFIAMTGTPLMKRERNTARKFGGIIDSYTVNKAVEDGAVVPLKYEGRHAFQEVNVNAVDNFFRLISETLSEQQRTDLKRKFSRADHLNVTDQRIYAIAWDISNHFRDTWQGSPFKGQLVCPSKLSAILYKQYLDEIGIVSTEVLISAPDEREGETDVYDEESPDKVKAFWKKMMKEHGTPKKYEDNLINRFKYGPQPEIIIVVDKLLTGFDAPINTVMYLTRPLKDHTLLQAIARVNRVHPGKDFGFIIDYYGVLFQLDEALKLYSEFDDFDPSDLEGTLAGIEEEIKKLPQRYSELWDIFKEIANKKDGEAFEDMLRDEAKRAQFYEKLQEYAKSLRIALSTIEFHRVTPEPEIDKYKHDIEFFLGLRSSVRQRYSDTIDYGQYEQQIQGLLDKHIHTDWVSPITNLVNIFDKDAFQQELEKATGAAAKADKIASRTARTITEKMDEDPAFYKKFSQMLKDAIREYMEHRISEAQYLQQSSDIMEAILNHTDKDVPPELEHHEVARAFYGLCREVLTGRFQDDEVAKAVNIQSALTIDDIIVGFVMDNGRPIVDWEDKSNITGRLLIAIGDYLIDEVKDKHSLEMTMQDIDEIADRCIQVAKKRYK